MAKKKKVEKTIELSIKGIKEIYDPLIKKYSLPSYKELNEEFDISKIDVSNETILSDIRKAIINKLSAVLNFVELLLNPTNGSMFHMYLVKSTNGVEKEILNRLFDKLGSLEIDSFKLDIDYSEKAEAEFISNSFKEWDSMKDDLNSIMSSLKKNWHVNSSRKEKSYFG